MWRGRGECVFVYGGKGVWDGCKGEVGVWGERRVWGEVLGDVCGGKECGRRRAYL